MSGFISAIRACLPCMGVSPSHSQIHLLTPEAHLLHGMSKGDCDVVKEAIASFGEQDTLSWDTKNKIDMFLMAASDGSDSNLEIKKELFKFLFKPSNSDGETLIAYGKAIVAYGQRIIAYGETQLAVMKKNDPAFAAFLDELSERHGNEDSTVTAHPADATVQLYGCDSSSITGRNSENTRVGSTDSLPGQSSTSQVSTTQVANAPVLPKVVKNFKLLIADDTFLVANMHMRNLTNCDIDIYWVKTTAESLKAMRGESFSFGGLHMGSSTDIAIDKEKMQQSPGIKFDIVLHDFQMGKGDSGPETVKKFRETENASEGKRLRILAFSTNISTENPQWEENHYQANFDGIADKPGSLYQTLEACHAALGDEYIQMPQLAGANLSTSF